MPAMMSLMIEQRNIQSRLRDELARSSLSEPLAQYSVAIAMQFSVQMPTKRVKLSCDVSRIWPYNKQIIGLFGGKPIIAYRLEFNQQLLGNIQLVGTQLLDHHL